MLSESRTITDDSRRELVLMLLTPVPKLMLRTSAPLASWMLRPLIRLFDVKKITFPWGHSIVEGYTFRKAVIEYGLSVFSPVG